MSRTSLAPIVFVCDPRREQGTAAQIITLTIQLGSGTYSFYSRIVDNDDSVQLKVQWATPIVNVEILHRKWLQPKGKDKFDSQCFMDRYYPKY